MSDLYIIVLCCLVLGAVVGFLAGLLGIGGGLVIVPVLSAIIASYEIVEPKLVIVVAVATSLATIIFTSSASAWTHHKNNNVPWEIAPWIMAGVAGGSMISGLMAAHIDPVALKLIFVVFVSLIAIKMLLGNSASGQEKQLPSKPILTGLSSVVGGVSGLLGIGGGALLVPILNFFSVDLKKAIGCSAACGIVIAFSGTLGFTYTGLNFFSLEQGFLGFIYLPALAAIVVTSAPFATLGAKAVNYAPVSLLKRILAILLIIMGIRMLIAG